MAQSPISWSDPFEACEPNHAQERNSARGPEIAGSRSLSKSPSALAAGGGGSVFASVALALVLNEVVQQACAATSATAGAIALAQGDEMVCRAMTGENAPDLGIRLDTKRGLAAACVRTRQWQRCNDTDGDSRVNSEVCRRLGVRSILAVPIERAEELIGIMEIFSNRPNAFGDREIQCLQTFSLNVVENVERALETQVSSATVEKLPRADCPEFPALEPVISTLEVPLATEEAKSAQEDFSTIFLLVGTILLALFLGWMVGRAEWPRSKTQSVKSAQVVKNQTEVARSDSSPLTLPEPPAHKPSEASNVSSQFTGTDSRVDDGLVVTRNGKIVFRSPSQHANDSAGATQPIGNQRIISPQITERLLVTRIEPEYPEQAKKDHVEGPVILEAWVGKDGTVEKLTAVSGNPELVGAATQAVQQWHFRPFLRDGRPQKFTTRITVVFRLP